MIHRLKFMNPIYHRGINSTVRLGSEWAYKTRISDTVEIIDTLGKVHAHGEIKGILLMPFFVIPEEIIYRQHDPCTADMQGLIKVLKKAYKDDFNHDSLCSVILFEIISEEVHNEHSSL